MSEVLLGAIGTALGIINSVHAIQDRKIKLKVTYGLSFTLEGKTLITMYDLCGNNASKLQDLLKANIPLYPTISIINCSKFSIWVEEVGMGWNKFLNTRAVFRSDEIASISRQNIPCELQPFSSTRITFNHDIYTFKKGLKYIYVETADRRKFFCNVSKFEKIIERYRIRT